MGSIPEVVEYVEFGRAQVLASIDGLSHREMTEIPVFDEWAVKDVLAHVIGWDRRVIKILPMIVHNRANEVPGVEVEAHNRQSVIVYKDKTITQVLADIRTTHQQILAFLSGVDYKEIDRRHERQGRFITIRSYVIDVMVDHERQHAAEIEQWRLSLDEAIDPVRVKTRLWRCRDTFMKLIDRFDEAGLLDKTVVGEWSVSDAVGHIADWEERMLAAARRIVDPSLPEVPPVSTESEQWNDILAARRSAKSWAENYADLCAVQKGVDEFMANLTPEDYTRRGPYPWPNEKGSLAELLDEIADHYTDHVPDLQEWVKRNTDSA